MDSIAESIRPRRPSVCPEVGDLCEVQGADWRIVEVKWFLNAGENVLVPALVAERVSHRDEGQNFLSVMAGDDGEFGPELVFKKAN